MAKVKIEVTVTDNEYEFRFKYSKALLAFTKDIFIGRKFAGGPDPYWHMPRCAYNWTKITNNRNMFSDLSSLPDDSDLVDIAIDTIAQLVTSAYIKEIVDFMHGVNGRWDGKSWAYPKSYEKVFFTMVEKLRLRGYTYSIDRIIHRPGYEAKQPEEEKSTSAEVETMMETIGTEFDFLRNYQVEDVSVMVTQDHILNANEMGLGKTLESLCAMVYLMSRDLVSKCLIITPTNLKTQWRDELFNFFANFSYPVQVIDGGKETREFQWTNTMDLEKFVIITHYANLRTSDFDLLKDKDFDLVIFDEASKLKNYRSKISIKSRHIANRSRRVFGLTGTPIESHIMELFTIMTIIAPAFFGNFANFRNKYLIEGTYGGYEPRWDAAKNIGADIAKFNGFIRWKKQTVLTELPDKIEVNIPVELSSHELFEYRKLEDMVRSIKKADGTTIASTTLSLNTSLQRLLAESSLYITNIKSSTKRSAFMDYVKEYINGEKVLVFSKFREVIVKYSDELTKVGIGNLVITGGMDDSERDEIVAKFSNDDKVKILLCTDAMAYGSNIQAASIVVNIDLPWTPAIYHQRNARAWRMGQKNTVTVVNFVVSETIDERVVDILQRKQEVFDETIEINAKELVT